MRDMPEGRERAAILHCLIPEVSYDRYGGRLVYTYRDGVSKFDLWITDRKGEARQKLLATEFEETQAARSLSPDGPLPGLRFRRHQRARAFTAGGSGPFAVVVPRPPFRFDAGAFCDYDVTPDGQRSCSTSPAPARTRGPTR